MGRWLMIVLHCDRCATDREYLWDQTYEDIKMISCPTCECANMTRRTGAGSRVMKRALPDGTSRGEEYERAKRLANLTCDRAEHFEGTPERAAIDAEIRREGGSVSTDVAFTT